MLLCASYFDAQFERRDVKGRIAIKASDADVLALAVHYFPKLKNTEELWVERGSVTKTTDLRRFVPVHAICQQLTALQCNILPAVHALTGCDSTSSLFGIGKKSVFKLFKDKADNFKNLTSLSKPNKKNAMMAARQFVIQLYETSATNKYKDLNDMRAKMSQKKSQCH